MRSIEQKFSKSRDQDNDYITGMKIKTAEKHRHHKRWQVNVEIMPLLEYVEG
jgi:hypothetical protein